MSEFVNKVVKNGGEWEIRDARVPQVEQADYDKFLHVNAETGALEYVEAGGDEVYDAMGITTIGGLFELVGLEPRPNANGTKTAKIKNLRIQMSFAIDNCYQLSFIGYGSMTLEIYYYANGRFRSLTYNSVDAGLDSASQDKSVSWSNVPPALPYDASSKTYVLKAVNGSLQWVEEQA